MTKHPLTNQTAQYEVKIQKKNAKPITISFPVSILEVYGPDRPHSFGHTEYLIMPVGGYGKWRTRKLKGLPKIKK